MLARLVVLAVVVLGSSEAHAQLLADRGPPQFRLVHRNALAVRINPLGLIYDGRLMARLRLYESQSSALRDNFVSVGASLGASPAFFRAGAYVEVQPLTVFSLFANYEVVSYFGSINLLQSFPGARSDASDTAIRTLGALPATDVRRNYPGSGSMFTLGANLVLKLGPIVVRDTVRLLRPSFNLRAGDTVFYDQFYDLVMPNNRFSIVNDADLLFQTNFGLVVGARYNLSIPLYGDENYVALGPYSGDNSSHRLGPLIAYRFFDTDGAAFNQPTLALLVNWYLKHPYRTGQDTPQGLPYFGLAFTFVGDLVPLPPATPAAAGPKTPEKAAPQK
jgi:hypothetical protein